MKKISITIAIYIFISVNAFAQILMSAGGGLYFNGNYGNSVEGKFSDFKVIERYNTLSFGIHGFFDMTYAEASIAVNFGSLSYEYFLSDSSYAEEKKKDITMIDFSLLGKYPFNLGKVTVFPLVGVGYTMVWSIEPNEGDNASDFNQFSMLFGAGLDFNFTQRIFLRTSCLFQIRFPNKFLDDMEKDLRDIDADTNTTWGMGPLIKIGIGYRF